MACRALRDLLFKFWDTLHIYGMGIARDFKFGVRIDRQACIAKNAKSRSEGSWFTSRELSVLIYIFSCGKLN